MKGTFVVIMYLIFVCNLTANNYIPNDSLVTPVKYTVTQDSAFYKAQKLAIPPEIRFLFDLKLAELKLILDNENNTNISKSNIFSDLEKRYPNLYLPSSVDVVLYQTNILNSQFVPFSRTIPTTGLKIPVENVMQFFGLVEDTSPKISYNLEFSSQVQIVVYNSSGIVISTLLNEPQVSGSYTTWWNLKNDLGILQPNGDYIAEVRIGSSKYFRKRIKLK